MVADGSTGFDPTSFGLPSVYLTSGILQFPVFQPEGYQQVGMVGYGLIKRGDDVQSITGNVTKIFSGHNLKVGAEARLMRLNYLQPGYPQGNFNFARATTNKNSNASSSLQGNAIASMLLGWGSGGDYHLDPPSASASKDFEYYAQDDWKLTRRPTVNFGPRYDYDVPRTERYDRLSRAVRSLGAGQFDPLSSAFQINSEVLVLIGSSYSAIRLIFCLVPIYSLLHDKTSSLIRRRTFGTYPSKCLNHCI